MEKRIAIRLAEIEDEAVVVEYNETKDYNYTIEKMAKAIYYKAHGKRICSSDWEIAQQHTREDYLEQAKSALEEVLK